MLFKTKKYNLLYVFILIGLPVKLTAQPIDDKVTKETQHLFYNIKSTIKKGIMFGHQDDLAYGVNWKYKNGRSDVKELTESYPAVIGWELGNIELDSTSNLDSVPFKLIGEYVRQAYKQGLISTISWHANNPLTMGTAWDTAQGTVASILPGGEKHELYKNWLNKIAYFFSELKGENGEPVPVLFRPYHELTGNWFWWCKSYCTPQQFKSLWKFTVSYLKDVKGLHNLLYVYNTADFNSEEEFLEYYPGDDFADMISFDLYQRGNPKEGSLFYNKLYNQLTILTNVAQKIHKIPALTETGYNTIPDKKWWTKTLWKCIKNFKLSYVLVWRNAGLMPNGKMHYFVPCKNDVSEKSFIRFYKKRRTLFAKQISGFKMYEPADDKNNNN